jgi:hypothetical protein
MENEEPVWIGAATGKNDEAAIACFARKAVAIKALLVSLAFSER